MNANAEWGTSEAITEGVRVTVRAKYLPKQSSPGAQSYVFAYHIRIANEGKRSVKLRSRHWLIRHSSGKQEEVRGPGVVGQQPMLGPGESFEYTSGCVLETPRGSMEGSFQMVWPGAGIEMSAQDTALPALDHEGFDEPAGFEAAVARFELAMPHSLN